MTTSAAEPTTELGHSWPQTPPWTYFAGSGVQQTAMLGYLLADDVPELQWPHNIRIFNKMRTDSQVDALIKSVTLPVRGLRWQLDPNGARDEIVQAVASDLGVPIKGQVEDIKRGRKRFNHDDHMRLALLAPTVYGSMFFEQVGIIQDGLWRLRKLGVRMPQSISQINVDRDGGLMSIRQWDNTSPMGVVLPVDRLVAYCWEREGANWTGRSMLRPLYKFWLLKDRMLRIDAIKNERFGAGIPTGTAPPGGDPTEYQKMAAAIRASENAGVGLPNGATIGVEGIRGTLPDTLGSIRYYDEAMARAFLAMFLQLGQTETGSRALGESFIDFFQDSLRAFADWYATTTNEHVIEDWVDWNYGEDEQAPLLMWEEREERPLDATELADLVMKGALIMDEEMQGWIRGRFNLPDYTGGKSIAVVPARVTETDKVGGGSIPSDAVAAGGKPSKGTPADQRLKENKKVKITTDALTVRSSVACPTCGSDVDEPCILSSGRIAEEWTHPARVEAHAVHDQTAHGTPAGQPGRGSDPMTDILKEDENIVDQSWSSVKVKPGKEAHPAHVSFLGSSQTMNKPLVIGHRGPTEIELAANTNFTQLQQTWENNTSSLVGAWQQIRSAQIDDLIKQITQAVESGDLSALASVQAEVLGSDVILQHLTNIAQAAINQAVAEATAQGRTIAPPSLESLTSFLQGRSDATAALLARGISESAARQAVSRYGEGVDAATVASGVRTQLESLSDSYLVDQLGGALTGAQNQARASVMRQAPGKVYASELLDQNTCDPCASEDNTEFTSVDEAQQQYPTGGYVNCLGGPRCRGTLVAVYDPED